MKNNKYILSILRALVIVLTVVLVVVVYWNGSRKMTAKRNDAIEALRTSAELVINRESEKQIEPVYVQKMGKRNYTKRKIVTESGTFTVTIDSLKEAQGLYSLETVGRKFRRLQADSGDFFDELLKAWKVMMNDEEPDLKSALKFTVTPLGRTDYSEYCVGDTAICRSRNVLGSYYLDDMYTTMVTAYFIPSPFIYHVEWTSWKVLSAFSVWLLLLGGLLYRVWSNHMKNVKDKNKTVFQIGEYSFDVIKQVLVYKGQEIPCPSQSCKLLYTFVTAPDYSLSNDEIARVCGWNLTDDGLDSRRRTAIRQLNKLLELDSTIKIVSNSKKNGYQLSMSS